MEPSYRHWGLKEAPFPSGLDPRRFFPSPTHEEALARLQFLVDAGRRLGVLAGPSGAGKSLLLELFAGEARRAGARVAHLSMIGLGVDEFLWTLAAAWGTNPENSARRFGLWRAVNDRLDEHRLSRLETVILADDADEAEAEVLTQLARLAQTAVLANARLTMILGCRSGREPRLGQRLLELAELRIDLFPWNGEVTETFLRQAIARVGRVEPLFEPEAAARLCDLGQGLPRNIIQLADLALIAAASQHRDRVDVHTVDGVYEELGVADAVFSS